MRQATPLIALASIASAALFISIPGGVGTGSLMVHFVQLPLVYVGLTLGLWSFSLGSLAATVMVGLFTGGIAAAVFVLVEVGPGLITVRHALLWRQGQGGTKEWFPLGMILDRLLLYVLAAGFALLLWWQWQTGDIGAAMVVIVDDMAGRMGNSEIAMKVHDLYRGLVPVLPGLAAAGLLLVSVINAALAFKLAAWQQGSIRPNEPLRRFELSGWYIPALMVVIAGSMFVGGDAGFFLRTALMLLATAFLLVGLALVHSLAARWITDGLGRRALLTVFYFALALFSLVAVPAVAALGLVEDRAQLRRKMS
ncbi:MAG: hypothetical protein R3C97_09210 [Geminicoccaceae bacterium]